jgi:MoaA/NifB/PqqE/SkfB family radical SAM enzyme
MKERKYIEIQIEQQYAYHPAMKSYPRGADLPDVKKYKCNIPSRALSIDFRGDCHICICEVFLPVPVGKITDFNSLEDVWNSPIAKELQKDIEIDRNFTYCAVEHCGVLEMDQVLDRYQISIDIDESCNLACPSCRREPLMFSSGPEFERRKKIIDHTLKLIDKFDKPLTITNSGGDIFASNILRPLFIDWIPKSSQKFVFATNGLLIKKILPKSNLTDKISQLLISIDAGTKEVYEIVRSPAKFDTLIKNLEWLSAHRHLLPNAEIKLRFVMQATNAGDLINFAKLCKRYGFQGVASKVDDWGTWDNFADHDIANPNNPMHQTAIEQVIAVLDNYDKHEIYIQDNLIANLNIHDRR